MKRLKINRHYTTVRVYEVIQTSQAVMGQVLANPVHGQGGLPQIVIQNGATVLRPLFQVILDKP